jgi:hypothetical protein
MSDFKLVKLVGNPITISINISPKGAYSSSVTYLTGDSVSYGGSSYIALTTTLNNLPTNTTYWQVMALGGVALGESGYIYQLTSGDISAKQITLVSTPVAPSLVKIDIQGGCIQIYGVDFTVTSNILSWNALGMETVISSGDYIQITY